jgi:hypothetical protein
MPHSSGFIILTTFSKSVVKLIMPVTAPVTPSGRSKYYPDYPVLRHIHTVQSSSAAIKYTNYLIYNTVYTGR